MSALSAATAVLITVHPQMLDVLSMAQFLTMTGDLLEVVADAGGTTNYDRMNYLVTRFEPSDGPQNQMVAFLVYIRIARAHSPHVEKHGNFRCVYYKSDTL